MNQDENMVLRTCFLKLFISVILILLSGDATVYARRKRDKPNFQFKDCGKYQDRPIHFYHAELSPIPIVTPGTLYISMAGNISYTLPRRLSIKLEVTKYWIGIPFMVPCFDKVGSCTYENICSNLEVYERRKRCPKRIRKYKLPCYCPFQAGEFRVKDLAINIPKIGGYAGALVKGDYGVVVKLLDENYDELGCIDMKFSMKKRHRGWLFRI